MPPLKVRKLKYIPPELTVPGDKSISHRAVMFAGLCDGTTIIENFLPSEDCLCSLHAMQALGAEFEVLESDDRGKPTKLAVTGHGMKLKAPVGPIDCGNSGTTMRLMSGILAAQPFESTLIGDESLSKRPMKRVADPLSQMGATVTGQGEKICAPLTIHGGALKPVSYQLPMASAQVKSAVLLAGWNTPGKTSVIEPTQTRDHTERLLAHFHVKCLRDGNTISIYGGQNPVAQDLFVPGDISSAAFWMVAVGATRDAKLTLKNVGLNPSRTGIINVLIRMGAKISDTINNDIGEPRGNLVIHGCELNATHIAGGEIPNVIDELPILAVAAALARGNTVIRDAAELRVKETDRIAAVAHNLRQMGVPVDEFQDGMEITGGQQLKGTELTSFGDHRIAMAFAIAGLFAEGVTTINDTDCIATSYPGFEKHLELFLNEPKQPEEATPVISSVPPKVGYRLAQPPT
ncbi:MAG: 3-phosphoshikimate 1-carboxyvinyltransferase [Roseimicrobium sp.]